VAGVTLAALSIPAVMGYTKIVGLPVITGLYTIFLPVAAFAFLGSSRVLVVGADILVRSSSSASCRGHPAARSTESFARPRVEPSADQEERVMIVKRFPSKFPFVATAALAVLLIHAPSVPADESDVWNALARGGHVALIRHGNAPPGYGGDPPGFRIDDCKTQRNMDDKGRAQSKALGEAFREHGVRVDRVAASPVCRCQSSWKGPGTLVLVSHGEAIKPLVGFMPMQAEIVVLKPEPGSSGGGTLVGTIGAP
jgi:hypothetical protein